MSLVTFDKLLADRGIVTYQAHRVLGEFSWGILYARGQNFLECRDVQVEAAKYDRGERPTTDAAGNVAKPFVIKGSEFGFGIDDLPHDFNIGLPEGVRLYYCDIWLHLPSQGKEHTWSQNFHRDPEGDAVYKVFAYLNDVDENTGPFEYVLGSHKLGTYPEVPLRGYPKQNIPAEHFGKAHQRYTGKAGTMIVANTAGIHRGGVNSTKPRLLATWAFLP